MLIVAAAESGRPPTLQEPLQQAFTHVFHAMVSLPALMALEALREAAPQTAWHKVCAWLRAWDCKLLCTSNNYNALRNVAGIVADAIACQCITLRCCNQPLS